MPRSTPRNRQSGLRRRSKPGDKGIAEHYEGGHGAPYSPVTPETAAPDSPAVEEMKGRDAQGGTTDARRKGRSRTKQAGPPEPGKSPAGNGANGHEKPAARRQRRSHRTLH